MLQTIPQLSVRDRLEKAVMKAATSNVLLIENDNQLARLIAQELSCEGYKVNLIQAGSIRGNTTNSHRAWCWLCVEELAISTLIPINTHNKERELYDSL